jgi:hypothetical protein
LQHSTPIFVTLFSPTSVFRYLDGSSSLRLVTWDLAAGPFGAGISSPNEILCHSASAIEWLTCGPRRGGTHTTVTQWQGRECQSLFLYGWLLGTLLLDLWCRHRRI